MSGINKYKKRLAFLICLLFIIICVCVSFAVVMVNDSNLSGVFVLNTIQHYFIQENEEFYVIKVPLLFLNIDKMEINKHLIFSNEDGIEIFSEFVRADNISVVDDLLPYSYQEGIDVKLLSYKINLDISQNEYLITQLKISEKIINLGEIRINRSKYENFASGKTDFTYNHYSQGEIEYLEIKSNSKLDDLKITSLDDAMNYDVRNNGNEYLLTINNLSNSTSFYTKRQYLISYIYNGEKKSILPKETRSYLEPSIRKLLNFAKGGGNGNSISGICV